MNDPTTAPAPPARQHRNDVLNSAVGQLLHRLESYVPTESRKGDRGKLARLRRGAGKRPGDVIEATVVVYKVLPIDLFDDEADDFYCIATLFAVHPVNGDPVSRARFTAERGLGASIARMRFREDGKTEDDGVSRRVIALLNARKEGVPTHLRHLITLLHSRSDRSLDRFPINYRQLFFDLRDWEAPGRRVQRDWAAGFWRRRAPTRDDGTTTDDEPTTQPDPED